MVTDAREQFGDKGMGEQPNAEHPAVGHVEFARVVKKGLENNMDVRNRVEGLAAQIRLMLEGIEDPQQRAEVEGELERIEFFLQDVDANILEIKREVWDMVQNHESARGVLLAERIMGAMRDWFKNAEAELNEKARSALVLVGEMMRFGAVAAVVSGCAAPGQNLDKKAMIPVIVNTYVATGEGSREKISVEDPKNKFNWEKESGNTWIGSNVSSGGERKFIPRITMNKFDANYELSETERRINSEQYEDWWDSFSSKEQKQYEHFLEVLRWQRELFGENGDGIRSILRRQGLGTGVSSVEKRIFEIMRKHYMAVEAVARGASFEEKFQDIRDKLRYVMFNNQDLDITEENMFKKYQEVGIIQEFGEDIAIAAGTVGLKVKMRVDGEAKKKGKPGAGKSRVKQRGNRDKKPERGVRMPHAKEPVRTSRKQRAGQ